MTSQESERPALVTAAFLLMVALAAASELSSFDLWWHLAAGRWILAGGGIPRQDPFSHTAAGAQWIDHEWLFQCVVYGLHRAGDSAALVLWRALMIALAAGLAYRFVWREARLPTAAAALLMTPFVLAGQGRFIVRPELFTLLFSVLLLSALHQRRPRPPTLRQLWWIPALFVPWANLHAGMIVGIVLLGSFFGGRLLEAAWRLVACRPPPADDGRPGLRLALILTLGAAAAGLVNPFFHHVYTVPFELTALIETGLYSNMEWHRPALAGHWLYYLVLAASAVIAVSSLRRRSSWKRVDEIPWTALLPLLFLAAISLRYVRNVTLFSFLAPILLARLLARRGDSPAPRLPALRPGLAIAVLALAAAGFLAGRAGLGVDQRFIPVRAVDFLAEARPPGNLFNDMNTGGYAAWRLWPESRIFIDGRNEVFTELQRRWRQAEQDPRLWAEMLDDFSIGHALISYRNPMDRVTVVDPRSGQRRTFDRPFAAGRFPRQQWALVWWDDTAMVYVRRAAEAEALIAERESAHVYPESVDEQRLAIRQGRADAAACRRELERQLRADPGSWRARQLLAALQESEAPAKPNHAGSRP